MNLKIISSNIRFDNPADGDNSWSHRRLHLTQLLLSHSPDVIATQEGRFEQLKDFESLLQDFTIIDQHRSWMKERMYPSFFLRKTIFEVLDSGDIWLSDTPQIAGSKSFESAFPRLVTWTLVQYNYTLQKIFMVNTHLDHVKRETRIHQVKVLAEEIKKKWDGQCHLIIFGDFNDDPNSPVRQVLTDHFPNLVDSWKIFNNEEETSHHAFSGECQNGSRIDWILVDNKMKTEACLMDKSKSEGRYPSDHFPIVCNLNI